MKRVLCVTGLLVEFICWQPHRPVSLTGADGLIHWRMDLVEEE